ncbi:MAG TPA: hypothetical protein VIE67_03020, partial [Rudaea sp.]|uniref:hypothetical protein n=1 Tax=Rudaea sp. TaxID=2136325 RepID=UPI002F9492EC
QEKSRMVRVERYWHSPSARVFFKDGSNEEVTFIEGSSLDTPAAPVRRYKKMVDLVIDRSSPIRPHLEVASHGTGSRVEVETRLSPADRIARLPASAQRQLTVGFQDADGESDPQAMEFMADMGDRLSESSTTMAIQMEGQDPATVSRMQTVDQWVEGQKDALSKVGAWGRGKFTQLLKDVRQIGVTGPAASEDLYPQDIELVLAGVAGGQSDFQTFAEFKRIFNWKLRTGSASLPQDATENPEFFIRNEYRVAWKAEAAGLRRMSRIAAAAQVAPFIAIGASALVGSGAAGLEALGAGALDWAAARGVSSSLVSKWIGTSLLASSGLGHLIGAGKEAKAAGMDTTSPLNLLNVVSTAALRTFGVGEIDESITDKSILTHQSFGRSPWERVVGGVQGGFDALGASSMFVPEAPNVADTSAPRPGKTPSEPDTSSQAPKPDPTLTVKPGGGAGSGKPTGMLRDTDSVSQGVEVDASHPVFKNKTPSNDPPVSPNSEAAKVAVNATHDVPHGQQIDHAPGTPVPGQDLGPARMGKTPPTPDPNLKSNSEPKTGAQSDISSADSRGVPELISDEAATDRIPAGQEVGEVVGDYRIAGDKSFDGHTFKRDIYGLTNLRGKTVNIGPIMQLFRDFVQEAKAVGAMELKITGNVIVNKNVMGMQRIVAEFGGTIRKTGPMSNEIIIPLK